MIMKAFSGQRFSKKIENSEMSDFNSIKLHVSIVKNLRSSVNKN